MTNAKPPKGTPENPLTRDDVLRLIEENGGPQGLDLSGRVFRAHEDFSNMNLRGIIAKSARFGIFANLKGVNFEGAVLDGAFLSYAKLKGANLLYANLRQACLDGANLEGAILFGADLKSCHLKGAELKGTNLTDAELSGAFLLYADITSANIAFARWSDGYRVGEEAHLDDLAPEEVFHDLFNKGRPLTPSEIKRRRLSDAVDTYQGLRTRYTQLGMGDTAGEFFYREMECRRKALPWWPLTWEKLKLEGAGSLFGYGERPSLALEWVAAVMLWATNLYYYLGGLALDKALYYSLVSFPALGYGEWVKKEEIVDWVRWAGPIEALCGVFLMALFLTTFVRKMTR